MQIQNCGKLHAFCYECYKVAGRISFQWIIPCVCGEKGTLMVGVPPCKVNIRKLQKAIQRVWHRPMFCSVGQILNRFVLHGEKRDWEPLGTWTYVKAVQNKPSFPVSNFETNRPLTRTIASRSTACAENFFIANVRVGRWRYLPHNDALITERYRQIDFTLICTN